MISIDEVQYNHHWCLENGRYRLRDLSMVSVRHLYHCLYTYQQHWNLNHWIVRKVQQHFNNSKQYSLRCSMNQISEKNSTNKWRTEIAKSLWKPNHKQHFHLLIIYNSSCCTKKKLLPVTKRTIQALIPSPYQVHDIQGTTMSTRSIIKIKPTSPTTSKQILLESIAVSDLFQKIRRRGFRNHLYFFEVLRYLSSFWHQAMGFYKPWNKDSQESA